MGSPYLIRLFAIVIGSHKKRIIKIDPKRAEQSVFKEERCFLCRADLAGKGWNDDLQVAHVSSKVNFFNLRKMDTIRSTPGNITTPYYDPNQMNLLLPAHP